MSVADTQPFVGYPIAGIGGGWLATVTGPEASRGRSFLGLREGTDRSDCLVEIRSRDHTDSTDCVIVVNRPCGTALEVETRSTADATLPTGPQRVDEVAAADLTDEEARDAVLQFIRQNPASYVSDVAAALNLPIRRAFAIADALIDEGKIEVPEE